MRLVRRLEHAKCVHPSESAKENAEGSGNNRPGTSSTFRKGRLSWRFTLVLLDSVFNIIFCLLFNIFFNIVGSATDVWELRIGHLL